jgi:hypothetical protein
MAEETPVEVAGPVAETAERRSHPIVVWLLIILCTVVMILRAGELLVDRHRRSPLLLAVRGS